MIIDKIVGNINELDEKEIEKYHMEKVYIESANLTKRVQRLKTDHDREIGIRLRESKDLQAGDILFKDEDNMIIVEIVSDDLLVIKPRSINEMGNIAHQLGNRHLPAQFEGDYMLVQYDYLVEELLEKMEVPFVREERKVEEAFRHIGHNHNE